MAKKKIEYEYKIILYEVVHPANHARVLSEINDVEYTMHDIEAKYRALHVTCDDLCLTEYGRRFIGKFADMVRDNPKNKKDQYKDCFIIKKIDELGKLDELDVKLQQRNAALTHEDCLIFYYLERVGTFFVLDNYDLNMFRDDACLEIQFKSKKFGKYDLLEPRNTWENYKPKFILIQKVEKE